MPAPSNEALLMTFGCSPYRGLNRSLSPGVGTAAEKEMVGTSEEHGRSSSPTERECAEWAKLLVPSLSV